jgi:hypothetical protein
MHMQRNLRLTNQLCHQFWFIDAPMEALSSLKAKKLQIKEKSHKETKVQRINKSTYFQLNLPQAGELSVSVMISK